MHINIRWIHHMKQMLNILETFPNIYTGKGVWHHVRLRLRHAGRSQHILLALLNTCLISCYLRIENAEGYVLIAVYLLFLCVLLA